MLNNLTRGLCVSRGLYIPTSFFTVVALLVSCQLGFLSTEHKLLGKDYIGDRVVIHGMLLCPGFILPGFLA